MLPCVESTYYMVSGGIVDQCTHLDRCRCLELNGSFHSDKVWCTELHSMQGRMSWSNCLKCHLKYLVFHATPLTGLHGIVRYYKHSQLFTQTVRNSHSTPTMLSQRCSSCCLATVTSLPPHPSPSTAPIGTFVASSLLTAHFWCSVSAICCGRSRMRWRDAVKWVYRFTSRESSHKRLISSHRSRLQ